MTAGHLSNKLHSNDLSHRVGDFLCGQARLRYDCSGLMLGREPTTCARCATRCSAAVSWAFLLMAQQIAWHESAPSIVELCCAKRSNRLTLTVLGLSSDHFAFVFEHDYTFGQFLFPEE